MDKKNGSVTVSYLICNCNYIVYLYVICIFSELFQVWYKVGMFMGGSVIRLKTMRFEDYIYLQICAVHRNREYLKKITIFNLLIMSTE